MAYVTRVQVENLVGREGSLEISFERDLNVLWGLNGSGKTSLLRIIDSALQNDAAAIANVPFKRAVVEFYSENYETLMWRQLTREDASDATEEDTFATEPDPFALTAIGRDASAEEARAVRLLMKMQRVKEQGGWILHSEQPFKARTKDLRFARVYLPTSRLSTPMRRLAGPGKAEDLDAAFADQIERIWNNYNASSLQTIDTIRERGIGSILSAILTQRKGTAKKKASEVSPERAYDLVRRYLSSQRLPLQLGKRGEFIERYGKDPVLQEVVAEIVEVQAKIDEAREPQRVIESLLERFYSLDKRVSFELGHVVVNLREQQIPLVGLSSGERQVLYILLQCLSSNGSLIIIDEPELSMHVDWQHDLIAAMRAVAPRSQLILATHSPEIMADIPDRKIFRI